MDRLPLDQIVAVNRDLDRYRARLELPPTVLAEADIDLAERRQFWRIGLVGQPFPLSEVYWTGDTSLAWLRGGGWARVRGGPLGHELGRLADLISESEPVAIHESEADWTLEYRPDQLPLADALEAYLAGLQEDPPNEHLRITTERAVAAARTLQAILLLHIERRSLRIHAVDVELNWEHGGYGGPRHLHIDILPLDEPVPQAPDEARDLARVDIPVGALFLALPGIGGWSAASHGPWAQRALGQIQASEATLAPLKRVYGEIYHTGWYTEAYTEAVHSASTTAALGTHHPVVVGSLNEDAEGSLTSQYDIWFANDPAYLANSAYYYCAGDYKRSYHHFGGDGTGLQDKLYFVFHGPPSPTVGDRFYSARDWGYGYGRINESLNRLTFTRAIEQYHRYTKQGKRLAYLMMGHVVHLLQDVGQPDHAALVDHAGSSMDEIEAYKTYHYCEFLAAEAALVAYMSCGPLALVCAAGAFVIAETACWASASSRVMGYEKLIGEEWNIQSILATIAARAVIKDGYDSTFHTLAAFSQQESQAQNLSLALGTSTLLLVPPIPNADPTIDADDAGETAPYYSLTNAVVPEIIARTAGILEHFYDVANYPPFLERIMVVQFEPGQQPQRFGVLRENAPLHCTRYEARWNTSSNGRVMTIVKQQQLALDTPAYVFLLFGPSDVFPEGSKAMRNPGLRITGNQPGAGPLNATVALHEAVDPQLGPYYWGTFQAANCANDPYQITLRVSGEDAGPHASGRNPTGAQLDADPATLARVDISQPDLRWSNYTPGEDASHTIWVPVPVWQTEVSPPGHFTLNTGLRRDTHVKHLDIAQISWDCHWEPIPGRPTCPTTWTLVPDVRYTSRRGATTGPWSDYSLDVLLEANPRGSGMLLRVTANPETRRGAYVLTVNCTFGTFQRTLTVTFDVV